MILLRPWHRLLRWYLRQNRKVAREFDQELLGLSDRRARRLRRQQVMVLTFGIAIVTTVVVWSIFG